MSSRNNYYKPNIPYLYQDLRTLELLPQHGAAVKAIEKAIKLELEFPGILQADFFDHLEILADSARKGKYPLNNWLENNGMKCQKKVNYRSIQNHIDQELQGIEKDEDSGRPPKLHAACRLMMSHVREQMGIYHDEDEVE